MENDTDPAHVIRSLRVALDMSQAQFARAAGWSPSTISSWERGRAKPSRLAFKTILAFAEERGVRYRPRAQMTALVPLPPTAGAWTSPGPRAGLRPLLYPETIDVAIERPRLARAVRGDERPRWRGAPGLDGDAADPARGAQTSHAAAPRWSAEASFRVTLGARGAPRASGVPRGVIEAVIVATAFCVALAVGLPQPIRRLLRPTPPPQQKASAVATQGNATQTRVAPVVRPPAERVAAHVATGTQPAAATAGGASVAGTLPTSAGDDDRRAPVAADAPQVARLESILAVNGTGRATFRTGSDTVTVIIGDELGTLRVAAIGGDGVTLVDAAGGARRVRLGQQLNVVE
jgi:transcriptional regulator with XRE-family HTH domain